MAMGITGKVIELLQIPPELSLAIPDQSMFSIGSGAKWLIVIVLGFILIFQYIKLLFEIGERYVVTSVLTFFAAYSIMLTTISYIHSIKPFIIGSSNGITPFLSYFNILSCCLRLERGML